MDERNHPNRNQSSIKLPVWSVEVKRSTVGYRLVCTTQVKRATELPPLQKRMFHVSLATSPGETKARWELLPHAGWVSLDYNKMPDKLTGVAIDKATSVFAPRPDLAFMITKA
jgi:hypothetical protein